MFMAFAAGGLILFAIVLVFFIPLAWVVLISICLSPLAFGFTAALRRKDVHCETILLRAPRFFKGGKQRILIAGGGHEAKTKKWKRS